jgi:hypothetical protein
MKQSPWSLASVLPVLALDWWVAQQSLNSSTVLRTAAIHARTAPCTATCASFALSVITFVVATSLSSVCMQEFNRHKSLNT